MRIQPVDGYSPLAPLEFQGTERKAAPQAWSHVKEGMSRCPNVAISREGRPELEAPRRFGDEETLLLQLYSRQSSLREDGAELAAHQVKDEVIERRKESEEKLKKLGESGKNNKYASYLGWARSVLSSALLGGGLVSTAILFFTGSALPPMVVAAKAFAAASTGVATAAETIYRYKSQVNEGEIKELAQKKLDSDARLKKAFEEDRRAIEKIKEYSEYLKSIVDNIYETQMNLARR